MNYMIKYIVIPVVVLLFMMGQDVLSSEVPVSRVEVRAAPGGPLPGGRILIGVRFTMDEGWHTYAENPGDSGLPPGIRVKGPDGMRVEKWKFPPPTTFRDAAGTTYGYAREVVLLGAVRLPESTNAMPVLTFAIDWMVCKDICIPLDAVVTLAVNTLPDPAADRRGWESFLEAGGWSACGEQETGADASGKETR